MEASVSATEPSPEYVTTIAEWTDVPAAMEAVEIARRRSNPARAKRAVLTEAEKAEAKKAAHRKWYAEHRKERIAAIIAWQRANREMVNATQKARQQALHADAMAWRAAKRAAAKAAE